MQGATLIDMSSKFGKSPLALVKFLLDGRRGGELFFREDATLNSWFEPIEIYWCSDKGSIEYRNAFPIPLNLFRHYRCPDEQRRYLSTFYERYYGEIVEDFSDFVPFKSKKYVWMYRKKKRT